MKLNCLVEVGSSEAGTFCVASVAFIKKALPQLRAPRVQMRSSAKERQGTPRRQAVQDVQRRMPLAH